MSKQEGELGEISALRHRRGQKSQLSGMDNRNLDREGPSIRYVGTY
jgi:hypothetical protein